MKQRQVILTGFRAKNYKTIEAVNFTYDLMKNQIINITGEIGSSKTSVLECVEIALTGVKGIDKKDMIQNGFLTELQLTDGDIVLWLGVKTHKKTKGDDKGSLVVETFIYTKDDEGNINKKPIIDGQTMTAKDYIKILNSDLSFNLKDLFSKNATTHRTFIQKIYNTELKGLGVDEVVDRIHAAKKDQDSKRALCEAAGAFMTTFKAEGYDEEYMSGLKSIDAEKVREKQVEKEIERDRILNGSNEAKELAQLNAQNKRKDALEVIKTKANKVVESIREMNEAKLENYRKGNQAYNDYVTAKRNQDNMFAVFVSSILNADTFLSKSSETAILDIGKKQLEANIEELGKMPKKLDEPRIIPIKSGIVEIPEEYDKEYAPDVKLRAKYLTEYTTLKNSELKIAEIKAPDTTKVDKEIDALKAEFIKAGANNDIFIRYNQWQDWIEAKGLYQKEIDTLRKLYAKVKTGVEGLSIVPTEKGGRVEIWLQYDGSYDPDFFGNNKKDLRYITEYSESQRGVIAILLQAARLDKKPKALRLALIDSTPFYTKVGMKMLERIQGEKKIHLITTHTSDAYDKEDLSDGTVVMEGGEAFFKIK